MLRKPPGLVSGLAARPDDQGVDDSAWKKRFNEAQLAMLDHPVLASKAGPNGDDCGGDDGSGAPVPRQPSGEGRSSGG